MPETASILAAHDEPDELAIAMLVALLEHKVLSTYQFKVLFFASLRTAQTYVKSLKDRELICTFAWKASGHNARESDRHYLSAAGKEIAARASGRRRPDLIWAPADDDARAGMAHRAGVTGFFCHLIDSCEHTGGYGVHLWRPEHKLRSGPVELQPDGAGRLLHPGGAVEFSYEFDRGSEHRSVLRTKLAGYGRVWMTWPKSPSPMPIVLWVVPSFERENLLFEVLCEALERIDPDSAVRARPPIYSTNLSLLRERKHLGAIWQEIIGDGARLRFDELPSVDGGAFSLSECLGRRWRERPEN